MTILYVEATFVSYRRNKRTQNMNQALLQIDGVHSKEEAKWYVGHAVQADIIANEHTGTEKGINMGKIMQEHGNSGVVRAKFDKNLPSTMLGKKVRVMLYPSTI